MNILAAFMTTTALLLTAPATAQDQQFLVNGLGTLSCGKVLDNLDNPVGRAEISDWLNGFVTAYNYYHDRQLVTPPDRETHIAFVDSYCRKNPLSNIVAAGVSLVESLGGKSSVLENSSD
jgi:hypothetical protein